MKEAIRWSAPFRFRMPIGPGTFGYKRKYEYHTGVDLYCEAETEVFAVESGVVVQIGNFTGPSVGSPWWLETKYVMIEGFSGVVNYGEIEPYNINIGDHILIGQKIGKVLPVLKQGAERPEIIGHSRWMCHLELYSHGVREPVRWALDQNQPATLKDPTSKLSNAVS